MLTIIVPVYNIIEHLTHCVESLMAQECDALEIILVDDGSADGSGQLCDRYADLDPRIRVIHKCNGGLSSARNAGLDAARGQWILFVDGDDYLTIGAVSKLLALAAQHPDADFIQFHYQETSDTHWQPEEQILDQVVLTDVQDFFQQLYKLGGVAASACTKLFRRESIGSLRFRPGIRHEDEEFITRYLPTCRKAVYTELTLYGYVMRAGSIVHSPFDTKSMDVFTVMNERVGMLKTLGHNDLVTQTNMRIFQTAAWHYCGARRGGFTEEAARLKEILLSLSKETLPLSGQYRILHRLAGISPAAVELYYFVRRITGKT